MDNRFVPLAPGEVLSIDDSVQILIGHHTFRVGEFAEAIKMQLEYAIQGWTQDKDAWFSQEGIPCEVLRFSAQGWQKGKVRINLEFCPLDPEEAVREAAASHHESVIAAPPASISDELDSDELDLDESLISMQEDEFDLEATGVSADALELGEAPTSTHDEFDLEVPAASAAAIELGAAEDFDLETPAVSFDELEQDEPSTIYGEMQPEVSMLDADDEFDLTQMSTSLDDEFDQISESIEQELELVGEPTVSDDELQDLGDVSEDTDDDLDFGDLSVESSDDLDFGDMSTGGEDEFQFEDISLSDDLEDNETDSLLDDVWQDINQPSWQNNQ